MWCPSLSGRELPGKEVNPSLCSYLTVHVFLDCMSVILDWCGRNGAGSVCDWEKIVQWEWEAVNVELRCCRDEEWEANWEKVLAYLPHQLNQTHTHTQNCRELHYNDRHNIFCFILHFTFNLICICINRMLANDVGVYIRWELPLSSAGYVPVDCPVPTASTCPFPVSQHWTLRQSWCWSETSAQWISPHARWRCLPSLCAGDADGQASSW